MCGAQTGLAHTAVVHGRSLEQMGASRGRRSGRPETTRGYSDMASYADAPLSRGAVARPAHSPLLGDFVARFQRWREYRRTLSELEGLDSRTLRDLGLSRGELRRVAREAVGY
jgi:uncharacterized protein YjiS (DUF1127 family)